MDTTEKAKVRNVLADYEVTVSTLDDKEKEVRNGLVRVSIDHESQTLPNKALVDMLEIGYAVSCVCGSMDGKTNTVVYFEKVNGITF